MKISQFLKEIDRINVNFSSVSYAELDKTWNSENMLAGFTRIYLILQGSAKIFCAEQEIDLTPGNVYIIPAGTQFSCECPQKMEKIFFHVNVLRYNHYDILNNYNKCIVLKNKQKVINDVFEHLKTDSVNSVLIVKNHVLSLLIEALYQEKIELGSIENYSKNIKNAMSFIEKNLSADLRICDISEALYISDSCLQKLFKSEVGVSVGKYINDRLMYRAQAMLAEKSSTIKGVSEALGYCDQCYFSRRFSQHFKMSPLSFKKKITTKN